MNWYKKAQIYNQEIMNHPNFIGFHCQRLPRNPKYNDYINDNYPYGNKYAEEFYIEILDALPFNLRDKAIQEGLLTEHLETPPVEKIYEWSQKVEDFLKIANIRWIFVSQNKPLKEQYGNYCYYVLLPKNAILHIFDDTFVNDMAWAYLYDANKAQPECIELNLEEDIT